MVVTLAGNSCPFHLFLFLFLFLFLLFHWLLVIFGHPPIASSSRKMRAEQSMQTLRQSSFNMLSALHRSDSQPSKW
jgi:hypothetical protein